MSGRNGPQPDGKIRIVLPADPRFLAALRVSVRAAAALGDLDSDDIEDMQSAADEAATLLLDVAAPVPNPELTAELTVSSSSFRARISVPCAPGRIVARDGLAWLMLIGLDPHASVTDDGRKVSIAFGRTQRVA